MTHERSEAAVAAPHQSADGAHPFAQELAAAGVPQEAWGFFTQHGVGTLLPKLGIIFDQFKVDELIATMPVQGNTQVAGILHGGATAALAETLGSFAAALHTVNAGQPELVPVGVDLNVTHHRGGGDGLVRAVCIPLHLGRTTTTHEISVFNDQQKRMATARITNQLIKPR